MRQQRSIRSRSRRIMRTNRLAPPNMLQRVRSLRANEAPPSAGLCRSPRHRTLRPAQPAQRIRQRSLRSHISPHPLSQLRPRIVSANSMSAVSSSTVRLRARTVRAVPSLPSSPRSRAPPPSSAASPAATHASASAAPLVPRHAEPDLHPRSKLRQHRIALRHRQPRRTKRIHRPQPQTQHRSPRTPQQKCQRIPQRALARMRPPPNPAK